MSRFTMPGLLVIAVLTLAGCTPWATYPPIEGAAGLNEPGMAPIPTVMAKAIADTAERAGDRDVIVFNLPAGITESVYNRVQRALPGESAPMIEPDPMAIHVTAIRIRGTEAKIDVVDLDAGVPQMTTVTLRQDLFSGWTVTHRRRWRVAVDEPAPHFPGRTPVESISDDEEPPASIPATLIQPMPAETEDGADDDSGEPEAGDDT